MPIVQILFVLLFGAPVLVIRYYGTKSALARHVLTYS